MIFDRTTLISLILQANYNHQACIYRELMKIYYCLLNQESINSNFIDKFYYYEELSTEVVNYYLNYQ